MHPKGLGTTETWSRRLGHCTQTGLTYSVENNPNLPVWVSRSSHLGLSHHRAPSQPPSHCQLSWRGTRCGCHALGHDGSATDLPKSTRCRRRLHSLAGGYSDSKRVLMCHKTKHRFLLPPPSPQSWAVSPVLTTALQPHCW